MTYLPGAILRLEVDSMRASILQVLSRYSGDMEAAVDAAIKKFDFAAEVEAIVAPTLRDCVRSAIAHQMRPIVEKRIGEIVEKVVAEEFERLMRKARR